MKREIIRVLWEHIEFHGDETLVHCFQNMNVLGHETPTEDGLRQT